MQRPRLSPLTRDLPETVPFVGPEALERRTGVPFRARIGANESSFGPSPSVIAAMAAAAPEMFKYCDPESHELREALARKLGVAADEVVIGEGIDGLINLTCRLFLAPGDPVVTSLGAYPTVAFSVAGAGGRLVAIPYRDDRSDLEALAETAQRENAPLVYLSNPDNPMGRWWPAEEIERFIAVLPETSLLILDEAYGETAPPGTLPPIRTDRPNVIRYRTFSKAYGLAGLRVGYAFGERATIRSFEKVRNHFGVNRMGQVAALAALGDRAYLGSVVRKVAAGRERIASIASANGLMPIPTGTNFVTVDCGRDGAYALAVLQALGRRGVFIRKPMAPVLDRCIRVSVGRPEELDVFAEELPGALREAAG